MQNSSSEERSRNISMESLNSSEESPVGPSLFETWLESRIEKVIEEINERRQMPREKRNDFSKRYGSFMKLDQVISQAREKKKSKRRNTVFAPIDKGSYFQSST